MTFGSAAMALLTEYSVDTVFGIPGVHTIELYRGVVEQGLRSFVPRHEQGAGFMADGYARISGKPGVCLLVTGPGVLNAATPIAQAWHDSVPMLVLAAGTETQLRGRNRGPLHDVPDQAGMLRTLCDQSVVITDPEQFAHVVEEAWQHWSRGRRRPVHLELPTDLLAKDVGPIARVTLPEAVPALDAAAVARAGELLSTAANPLILCGGGALRAAKEIQLLAETLAAPVLTTGNARGLLPHDHPLYVGTLLPFPAAQDLVAAADVVLAVGTEFSDVDVIYTGRRVPAPRTLIRVDVDAAQLQEPFPAEVGVLGRAEEAVPAISQSVRAGSLPAARAAAVAKRVAEVRAATPWTQQSVGHQPWLDAVAAALPERVAVAIDSTQLAYTAHHYLPWSAPGRWLAPYGLGTLGAALPMGLGAAAAEPDAPVLVLAGDGGALFTIAELATAHDMGGNVVVVLWDNAGYGEIRDSFDRASAVRCGVETTAHDLVTVARGFGLDALRVSSPDQLGAAITRGLDAGGPHVVVATEPGSPADRDR